MIFKQDIEKSLEVLRNGGLILYPTDTIWGIGCDATNEKAIERINQLKGRSKSKNLIILLENENNLTSYVHEVADVAYELIEYTEKPLTIIYTGAGWLLRLADVDIIGFRKRRISSSQKSCLTILIPMVPSSAIRLEGRFLAPV